MDTAEFAVADNDPENLKRLIQSISGIIWEADLLRRRFSYVSKQALPILGYPLEDWLNQTEFWRGHLLLEDAVAVQDVERVFVSHRKHYLLKYRMVTLDGRVVWIKDQVHVTYQNDVPVRLRGFMEDITVQKAAELKLYESQERYRLLVESAPDVIFSLSTSGGILTMLNPAFDHITGLKSDEWVGKSFIGLLHPDDVNLAIALYERTLSGEKLPAVQLRFRSGSGEYLYGEVTTLPTFRAGKCIGITGMVRDITDRKRAEEKLMRSAFYDALTGLPNRALLMDRLGHSLLRSKRHESLFFAVLFIDLDRFKVVNDSLGHRFGDELLVSAARRLEGCVRADDTVARIGGDEFVIVLDTIKDLAEAQEIAARIHQTFSLPFQLSGQEIFATASIGIALNSPKYEKAEEILRDADLAMYRAKSLGKARSEIFDSEMHSQAMWLMEMETDLRRSLEKQEFRIFYQPIVALSSGSICGVEALLRWQHPHRGMVEASEFIRLAEETGLIHSVGEFVLLGACKQLRSWEKQFGASFKIGISVNLSARQFSNPRLLQEVEHVLKISELEPWRLTLEITETALMENRMLAEELIRALHDLKIKLHIDDFGTGYSSLSYLRRFPIDALKIDQSFIHSIHENAEIVRTILALAKNLNLQAIAEGLETSEQVQQLIQLGCEYGQGYYFAEPLPADAVPEWLENVRFSKGCPLNTA
jgi:diguanylate cyclase (GGDEF)-like protein/PAS domain S-box-containing protein